MRSQSDNLHYASNCYELPRLGAGSLLFVVLYSNAAQWLEEQENSSRHPTNKKRRRGSCRMPQRVRAAKQLSARPLCQR